MYFFHRVTIAGTKIHANIVHVPYDTYAYKEKPNERKSNRKNTPFFRDLKFPQFMSTFFSGKPLVASEQTF